MEEAVYDILENQRLPLGCLFLIEEDVKNQKMQYDFGSLDNKRDADKIPIILTQVFIGDVPELENSSFPINITVTNGTELSKTF